MSEPEFDKSFYSLSVIGFLILAENILDTPQGCETIKQMFRDALVGAGTYENLCAIPEFAAAMSDIERIGNGESAADLVRSRGIPAPPTGTTVAQ